MSNHLRELLEILEEGSQPVFLEYTNNADRINVWKAALLFGEQSMCFYAGDVTEFGEKIKVARELVRPPYPTCWIEMQDGCDKNGKILYGHLLHQIENGFLAQTWVRQKKMWNYMYSWKFVSTGEITLMDGEGKISYINIINRAIPVFQFLTALNCVNVRQIETKQPAKLQASRIRRGKKPLFDYKTLYVDLPSESHGKDYSGDSCISDRRLHLCRGHIKHRKTGYFWWQAHVRGSKKAGIVHKDYSARYPSATPDGE